MAPVCGTLKSMSKGCRIRGRNWEAQQRARKARYLMRCVDAMELSYKDVAAALHVDPRRVRLMHTTVPQLHVLHALGRFVEERARERQGLAPLT